jgi:hypothetical protein
MAAVPLVTADIDGVTLANTTATAGPDTIAVGVGGGDVFLFVNNANAGTVVVTITTPGTTRYGSAEPDIASPTLAAGAHGVWRLPGSLVDPATGNISVTAVPNTSVTLYAVRAQ